MDGYVAKPLRPPEFFEVVESGAVLDRRVALERLGGDEPLFREVRDLFLERGPSKVETLRVAVGRRDASEVATLVHGLKGSLGTLGAGPALRGAAQLEERACAADWDGAEKAMAELAIQIDRLLRELSYGEDPSGGR